MDSYFAVLYLVNWLGGLLYYFWLQFPARGKVFLENGQQYVLVISQFWLSHNTLVRGSLFDVLMV
jgi:hypothetical protein